MGFYVQDDFYEALSDQSRKVRYEVLGALSDLYFTGSAPELKGLSNSFFVAFRERVLKARQKAEQMRNKRGTDCATDSEQNAKPPSQERERERESKRENTRFTPPTREEAEAYLASLGLAADLDKIFDHYESNGWKCGRNPMKDWKAAFRRAAREWAKGGDTRDFSRYAD